MSLPVHLVPSLSGAAAGMDIGIEGDEAHHAIVVRRLRVGESVVLVDGRGSSAIGEVSATAKRRFEVTLREVGLTPEPSPELVVVQALPKGERGEVAVEMMTEVGVGRIVPWAADRSVAVWKAERAVKSHAKWQATAREAAKQARRVWHPVIDPLASTAEVVTLLAEVDLAVVLHEDATRPLAGLDVPSSGRVAIIVGPEGGLTEVEVEVLTQAGAHDVRLGAEVLRTSTAGVVAAGVLLSRTPRWR